MSYLNKFKIGALSNLLLIAFENNFPRAMHGYTH